MCFPCFRMRKRKVQSGVDVMPNSVDAWERGVDVMPNSVDAGERGVDVMPNSVDAGERRDDVMPNSVGAWESGEDGLLNHEVVDDGVELESVSLNDEFVFGIRLNDEPEVYEDGENVEYLNLDARECEEGFQQEDPANQRPKRTWDEMLKLYPKMRFDGDEIDPYEMAEESAHLLQRKRASLIAAQKYVDNIERLYKLELESKTKIEATKTEDEPFFDLENQQTEAKILVEPEPTSPKKKIVVNWSAVQDELKRKPAQLYQMLLAAEQARRPTE